MSARGPVLVPGQPLPAAFTTPPLPQCGPGCYEYNGKILASIVGKPYRDGAVSISHTLAPIIMFSDMRLYHLTARYRPRQGSRILPTGTRCNGLFLLLLVCRTQMTLQRSLGLSFVWLRSKSTFSFPPSTIVQSQNRARSSQESSGSQTFA